MPQPQEAVATGLLILNEAPIRSSTKSISAPAIYCTETGSTSDGRAVAREHEVVVSFGAVEVEFVLKAGAAAAFDADPQHRSGRLALQDLTDPARRPFRQ